MRNIQLFLRDWNTESVNEVKPDLFSLIGHTGFMRLQILALLAVDSVCLSVFNEDCNTLHGRNITERHIWS